MKNKKLFVFCAIIGLLMTSCGGNKETTEVTPSPSISPTPSETPTPTMEPTLLPTTPVVPTPTLSADEEDVLKNMVHQSLVWSEYISLNTKDVYSLYPNEIDCYITGEALDFAAETIYNEELDSYTTIYNHNPIDFHFRYSDNLGYPNGYRNYEIVSAYLNGQEVDKQDVQLNRYLSSYTPFSTGGNDPFGRLFAYHANFIDIVYEEPEEYLDYYYYCSRPFTYISSSSTAIIEEAGTLYGKPIYQATIAGRDEPITGLNKIYVTKAKKDYYIERLINNGATDIKIDLTCEDKLIGWEISYLLNEKECVDKFKVNNIGLVVQSSLFIDHTFRYSY